MANKYSVGHETAAGTDLFIVNVTGDGTVRPSVYDFIIGSDATPADVATQFDLKRTTTAGAGGSALTESLLDPLSALTSHLPGSILGIEGPHNGAHYTSYTTRVDGHFRVQRTSGLHSVHNTGYPSP